MRLCVFLCVCTHACTYAERQVFNIGTKGQCWGLYTPLGMCKDRKWNTRKERQTEEARWQLLKIISSFVPRVCDVGFPYRGGRVSLMKTTEETQRLGEAPAAANDFC